MICHLLILPLVKSVTCSACHLCNLLFGQSATLSNLCDTCVDQSATVSWSAPLQDFTVLERENKVLGCALLLNLGQDEQGTSVAEVGAFCVDPAFRGSGRGDSLLDYVEQEARLRGIERLVLLTTRTADWFEQRDFKWVGPAYASVLLPESRRARVNPARNSQLYVKDMEAPDGGSTSVPPGKRIGF